MAFALRALASLAADVAAGNRLGRQCARTGAKVSLTGLRPISLKLLPSFAGNAATSATTCWGSEDGRVVQVALTVSMVLCFSMTFSSLEMRRREPIACRAMRFAFDFRLERPENALDLLLARA